jgi:hypothetical protein
MNVFTSLLRRFLDGNKARFGVGGGERVYPTDEATLRSLFEVDDNRSVDDQTLCTVFENKEDLRSLFYDHECVHGIRLKDNIELFLPGRGQALEEFMYERLWQHDYDAAYGNTIGMIVSNKTSAVRLCCQEKLQFVHGHAHTTEIEPSKIDDRTPVDEAYESLIYSYVLRYRDQTYARNGDDMNIIRSALRKEMGIKTYYQYVINGPAMIIAYAPMANDDLSTCYWFGEEDTNRLGKIGTNSNSNSNSTSSSSSTTTNNDQGVLHCKDERDKARKSLLEEFQASTETVIETPMILTGEEKAPDGKVSSLPMFPVYAAFPYDHDQYIQYCPNDRTREKYIYLYVLNGDSEVVLTDLGTHDSTPTRKSFCVRDTGRTFGKFPVAQWEPVLQRLAPSISGSAVNRLCSMLRTISADVKFVDEEEQSLSIRRCSLSNTCVLCFPAHFGWRIVPSAAATPEDPLVVFAEVYDKPKDGGRPVTDIMTTPCYRAVPSMYDIERDQYILQKMQRCNINISSSVRRRKHKRDTVSFSSSASTATTNEHRRKNRRPNEGANDDNTMNQDSVSVDEVDVETRNAHNATTAHAITATTTTTATDHESSETSIFPLTHGGSLPVPTDNEGQTNVASQSQGSTFSTPDRGSISSLESPDSVLRRHFGEYSSHNDINEADLQRAGNNVLDF